MLHDPQRLSGFFVNQLIFGAFRNFFAELVDQVARVCHVLGFFEFPAAGLPKFFAYAGLEFREFTPGLEYLGIVAEGGDAGRDQILVAGLRHQRELTGDYGHCCLLRDGVRVIGYAPAGGMMLCFVDIPP